MNFKDRSRVIRQPAHDSKINIAPRTKLGSAKFSRKFRQRLRVGNITSERFPNRRSVAINRQFRSRKFSKPFERRRTQANCKRTRIEILCFHLVASIEQRERFRQSVSVNSQRPQSSGDGTTMTQLDSHICWRQSQTLECDNRSRKHINFCLRTFDADQINIPLDEFSQSPSLRTLRAKMRWYCKPLHGYWQSTRPRSNHSRESWREFWAKRIIVIAASSAKTEKFVHNSFATFHRIEREMFKRRAVDFLESVHDRCVSPCTFDVTTNGHVTRIKISRSLWSLMICLRRHNA